MTPSRRAWYAEMCEQAGIDPRLDEYEHDDEPHAPRRRRRMSRPRTYAEILGMWALAAFGIWWLSTVWVVYAILLMCAIAATAIAAFAINRDQPGALFIMLNWAPAPAIVGLACVAVLVFAGQLPLAAPLETASLPPGETPAPTARPWFGGGDTGAGPAPLATAEVLRPMPDAAIVIVPTSVPLPTVVAAIAQPIAEAIVDAQPAAAQAGAQNAAVAAMAVVESSVDAAQLAGDVAVAVVESSADAAQLAVPVVETGAAVVDAAQDAQAAGQAAEEAGAPAAVGQAGSAAASAGAAVAPVVEGAQEGGEAAQEHGAPEAAGQAAGTAAEVAGILCWLVGCGR